MKISKKMNIKDNIYSYFTGKYIEGETDLDRLSTPALLKIFRKSMTDYVSAFKPPKLSRFQEKAVRDYYGRYSKTDLIYHRVYTDWHGEFHAEYMPDDLYYGKIEPYFCDRLFSKNIDNKCYYPLFFSSAPQPKTYAMRIGGKWLDGNYSFIDMDRLFSIIKEEDEAVLKRATFSQGGHGILFLSGKDKLEKLREAIQENTADLIIQAPVKQHPVFEELHPGSVNTLRFISLLSKDGVKIFARAVRIGRGNARVDNFSSGGLFCGVTEDGHLMDRAVSGEGRSFRTHPDIGYTFAGRQLPGCDKAEELIKKAHGIMAHCRIISWDIAIDHKGDALLIEPNLSLGIINAMQACSGPLFGQETRKILEEVFFDKKAKRRRKPFYGLNPRDYYYLRDSFKGILTGYYRPGYTHISLLSKPALRRIDKKLIGDVLHLSPELTKSQKKAVQDFYRPYVKKPVQTDTHRILTGRRKKFSLEYIPEDLYMCDIDPFLSDRELAYYMGNKCFYPRLFPKAKQPETLAFRMGGIWLDGDYMPISPKALALKLFSEKEVVLKPATGSEGGAGIAFLQFGNFATKREKLEHLRKHLKELKEDIVIQKAVVGHNSYNALHPASLNTLRIVTLEIDNEIVILLRAVRIGCGGNRVDNISAGGLFVSIDKDGVLGSFGAVNNGTTMEKHPDLGYAFSGLRLPFINKCDALVKELHPAMGHHRLISWDLAIDSEEDAVLIEANLALGDSDITQTVSGPLFGKYTERILKEVYGNN